MVDEPMSLKDCYEDAEAKRKGLESVGDASSEQFQNEILSIVGQYDRCLDIADGISLFSSNESLEDIASSNLKLGVSPAVG